MWSIVNVCLCFLVVIYRCRDMADNCGMCHALHEKYGCGWCQSLDRCEVKEQCDPGTNGPRPWLDSNQTCPQVEIKEFFPMLGPWEGGTNITIRGVNLGKSYDDIYGTVCILNARFLWGFFCNFFII